MFYLQTVVLLDHKNAGTITNNILRRDDIKGSNRIYHYDNNILRRDDIKGSNRIYHYENMPMLYTEIFKVVKNENFH